MNKQEKIQILKNLKPGQSVTLTSGKVVEFVEMKRTKFIATKNKQRYRVDAELFANVGEGLSDDFVQAQAKKQQEKTIQYHNKISELQALEPGDMIEVTNGHKVEFVKLNRRRFVGNQGDETYTFPIEMYVKLISKREINPQNEYIKALAKKYKGMEIQTGWGPSKIGSLTDDEKSVKMYEFGEELYTLKLDDFLSELKSNEGIAL